MSKILEKELSYRIQGCVFNVSNISYNLEREDILRNLKVLTDDGMTNAGVLFFAKEPHKYIHTSRVRCVYFGGDKRVEILDKKEVDRGIVGNIEFAVNYIRELVPVRFVIKKLEREEYPEYSEDAYREAIVNAIVHRDYFNGDEVAVEKLKSSIIVNNKGGLLFDEKDFGRKSEQRNRLVADLLSKTIYVEKAGTGIKRIKNACLENGNKVEFTFREDDFFIAIKSNIISKGVKTMEKKGVEKGVEKISENEKTTQKTTQKILYLIKKDPYVTRKKLSDKLENITEDGIKYHLKQLKQKGLIERIGPDKGGYWKILN